MAVLTSGLSSSIEKKNVHAPVWTKQPSAAVMNEGFIKSMVRPTQFGSDTDVQNSFTVR
jgi:hypothetical protein